MTYKEMCEKARTAKNENVDKFIVGFECVINSFPLFRNGRAVKSIIKFYFDSFCERENLKMNIIDQGKGFLTERIRVEISGRGTKSRLKQIDIMVDGIIKEIKQEMSMVL